jgi:DNA recombination protein RmuC
MDISLLVLSAALLIAAAIVAFAMRGRAPAPAPVEVPHDPRLDTVIAGQGDIQGRFAQTLEAQAQLQKAMAERIEALDKRLGVTLTDSATKTAATIAGIGERLTVIDEAQKNITALSGHVVSLQPAGLHHPYSRCQGATRHRRKISAGMFPDAACRRFGR